MKTDLLFYQLSAPLKEKVNKFMKQMEDKKPTLQTNEDMIKNNYIAMAALGNEELQTNPYSIKIVFGPDNTRGFTFATVEPMGKFMITVNVKEGTVAAFTESNGITLNTPKEPTFIALEAVLRGFDNFTPQIIDPNPTGDPYESHHAQFSSLDDTLMSSRLYVEDVVISQNPGLAELENILGTRDQAQKAYAISKQTGDQILAVFYWRKSTNNYQRHALFASHNQILQHTPEIVIDLIKRDEWAAHEPVLESLNKVHEKLINDPGIALGFFQFAVEIPGVRDHFMEVKNQSMQFLNALIKTGKNEEEMKKEYAHFLAAQNLVFIKNVIANYIINKFIAPFIADDNTIVDKQE